MSVQLHESNLEQKPPGARIERKFFLTPDRIERAYSLLRHICRWDGEYPSEQINSLYFDTADLDQHNRSMSGEYRKDKVRIRWYGRSVHPSESQTAFLELKTRNGFASTKQRLKLEVPADDLSPAGLARGIVPKNFLNDTLATFGYIPSGPLQPVIRISYWRYRFMDIFSGQRLALDTHIRSTLVISGLGYGERELELPGGVIEVKGTSLELPRTLRQMKMLDLDWSRFSKYSSCLEAHQAGPGELYRLAPSGVNFSC